MNLGKAQPRQGLCGGPCVHLPLRLAFLSTCSVCWLLAGKRALDSAFPGLSLSTGHWTMLLMRCQVTVGGRLGVPVSLLPGEGSLTLNLAEYI